MFSYATIYRTSEHIIYINQIQNAEFLEKWQIQECRKTKLDHKIAYCVNKLFG